MPKAHDKNPIFIFMPLTSNVFLFAVLFHVPTNINTLLRRLSNRNTELHIFLFLGYQIFASYYKVPPVFYSFQQ